MEAVSDTLKDTINSLECEGLDNFNSSDFMKMTLDALNAASFGRRWKSCKEWTKENGGNREKTFCK